MNTLGLNQCWDAEGCIVDQVILALLDVRREHFP
jgi:hypothetical protein